MTEAFFPLVGSIAVLLLILPISAVAAKGLLVFLERDDVGGPMHGSNLRYVVLLGSSALPLAWFISAGIHQAESGRTVLACLFAHEDPSLCIEPAFFTTMLAVGIGLAWRRLLRAERVVVESSSDDAMATLDRLRSLIGRRSHLAELAHRVSVTDHPGFAIGTRGLVHPRIVVGIDFAAGLSDPMLASALGHELEHVRGFDALRYHLLDLALAVNPLGRFLLAPHAGRWKAAREAHCDREAVIRGASPISLADAIVRAARPMPPTTTAALGDDGVPLLKLRIHMLLAFADRPPKRCCSERDATMRTLLALLFLALFLPHQTGTHLLDALHTGSEHALALVLR